jgi:Cu2+-exporting ATPase
MSRTIQASDCAHCGTPFSGSSNERFCCRGCEFVWKSIHQNGLSQFYDIKGNASLPPIGASVFSHRNLSELGKAQEKIEARGENEIVRGEFRIEGISCIACVWLIEAVFKRESGAIDIKVDSQAGEVLLIWRREIFKIKKFGQALGGLGYQLVAIESASQKPPASRQLASRIGICAFLLLNTMLFTLPGYLGMGGDFFLSPLFHLLGAFFATMSLIVGGGYFIRRAWHALLAQVLHIDLPISFGLVAAYLGSIVGWFSGYTSLVYFDFVSTFVFLMLVGRWLQEYTLERNHALLRRNKENLQEVILLGGPRDGERVASETLSTGQVYSIEAGAINPVAAELMDSAASLSMEWITGEPHPVVGAPNQIVPAGAINLGLNRLALKARENWRDSTLFTLFERKETDFLNKRLQSILKYYILAVLATGFLGGLGWVAATGDLLLALQVLTSVLVVSCPCALGVALPLCDTFANARLRKLGLFIKSNDIWERLRQVRSVIFDKTGTLTLTTPHLLNENAIHALSEPAAQALFVLVDRNAHPLARSLREVLLARRGKPASSGAPNPVTEYIGKGVAWYDPSKNRWTLGQPEWEADPSSTQTQAYRSVLRKNGTFIAGFDFAEDVRDDAREAHRSLRALNLETVILSGDINNRVQRVAEALKLPSHAAFGNCSSKDKAHWIEIHAHNSALMIGDGANDRLAFEKAICRGTPVAEQGILESASDFFFFGRSLRALPVLFHTAQLRRRTVTAVFGTAIIYNVGAVSICLAGLMHPLLAAILMPSSSLATLAIAYTALGRASPNHN